MWELDHKEDKVPKELMILNCGAGKASWESFGLQGDLASQSQRNSTPSTHWKGWCWNWSSNTLSMWCEELTHWKNPDAGKTEGRRRRGWQRMRWLDGLTDSGNMNLAKLWETVRDSEAWHAAVHSVTKSQTWLSDWTTAMLNYLLFTSATSSP